MALKKQITLQSNFGDEVVFNDAYIRVDNIAGNKLQLLVDVSVYKKQNDIVVDRKNYLFTPDLNGNNFISQAYNYLKTLPEFEGATDC
jgi:hypothetical protein